MCVCVCVCVGLSHRFAGTENDTPRDAEGRIAGGWHWNMPYSIKKDLPDWYMKERSRYTGYMGAD